MFRNREVKWVVILGIAGIAAVTLWMRKINESCAWMFLLFTAALLMSFVIITGYRYRQINRLSAYLKQILSGDYQMDLSTNEEGELSILKNDLYKLVVTLSTQADLLTKDKQYLADTLSDISHQLKTPMTSMMVMAELLSDEQLAPPLRRQFAEAVISQLNRMEWLISTLLTLSKMDAGTIRMKKERVKAEEMAAKAAEHLLIPMEMKGISFRIRKTGGMAEYTGDFEWSCEAVANILKNCMEHTPEGGHIDVECEERNLYTAIVIRDSGEGIDKEDMPHIFERFYRGKNASKDSVGIGLAMAKHVVEMQNGVIEVMENAEQGACFIIKFYKGII